MPAGTGSSRRIAPRARPGPSLVAFLLCAGAAGCGDDAADSAASLRASVVIAYEASTVIDPQVAAGFPACVEGVRRTHLHPGWRGFAGVDMSDEGGRWTATFADVPVGSRQRFRINDPNVCDEHPTGAVTRDVFANGVLLTEIVDTPGSGVEPGFSFAVAEDGAVTP